MGLCSYETRQDGSEYPGSWCSVTPERENLFWDLYDALVPEYEFLNSDPRRITTCILFDQWDMMRAHRLCDLLHCDNDVMMATTI